MRGVVGGFERNFQRVEENGKVTVCYTKERAGEAVHKKIKIYRDAGRFFLKEVEVSEATGAKRILQDPVEITNDSLQTSHAYVQTLFDSLKETPAPKLCAWKGFKRASSKKKWVVKYFLLDTKVVGGLIGKTIAYAANKENPHYKTVPSHILAKTLAPLVFPAGSKKPKLERKGLVLIDAILHKQYKSMKAYNGDYAYTAPSGEERVVQFEPKQVSMRLREEMVHLETVVAPNDLVATDSIGHLHIIYFNGNSGCYQQGYKLVAEDLIEYAKDGVPATAVMFNYPGVLNSEGEVEEAQELINAGIAQVKDLLDQGVPHDKIVLHGVSLGGSISSYVAAHFHKLKQEDDPKQRQSLGGLYVSRTFASTAQVGRDFFNRSLGNTIISRIISGVALPFIKLGTWGAGWDLDTGKAFFSLPRNKRKYSVVISPKTNIRAYRRKQKRPLRKKVLDFLLRRKAEPVDDAILGRGLHDSWERRKESFLAKWGFYGKAVKKTHSAEKAYRKMAVVDWEEGSLVPDVDGHAKASYCYPTRNKADQAALINPAKKERPSGRKAIGLVHRTASTIVKKGCGSLDSISLQRGSDDIFDHEAGCVARKAIQRMLIA